MLNVSYDPTREFYAEYNEAFAKYWKEKTGDTVKVDQSHGGSSKQARAVIDGLEADVVTLALGGRRQCSSRERRPDTRGLANPAAAQQRTLQSTMAFLVRKGNPKGIKDWDDLDQAGRGSDYPQSQNLRRCAMELFGRVGLRLKPTTRIRKRRSNSSRSCTSTFRCWIPVLAARPTHSLSANWGTCCWLGRTRTIFH